MQNALLLQLQHPAPCIPLGHDHETHFVPYSTIFSIRHCIAADSARYWLLLCYRRSSIMFRLFVCTLITTTCPAKTNESIEMPFAVHSRWPTQPRRPGSPNGKGLDFRRGSVPE